MIKDIPFKKMEDVAVAVAPREDDKGEVWVAYLVNMKDRAISGVLVNSKGYGTLDGKQVKTSSLRHFFEKIEGNDFVTLEILPEHLTGIANQFWVSFWLDGFLYDKQFVFVTESIIKNNLTDIPVLNKKGVMIR